MLHNILHTRFKVLLSRYVLRKGVEKRLRDDIFFFQYIVLNFCFAAKF